MHQVEYVEKQVRAARLTNGAAKEKKKGGKQLS